MARFDVYRNNGEPAYLLDCQSEMLSGLSTRVVVPLLPKGYAPLAGRRLNPTFQVEAVPVVMMTQFVAAVPERSLGEVVGSLTHEYTAIMNAFDMLLTGY